MIHTTPLKQLSTLVITLSVMLINSVSAQSIKNPYFNDPTWKLWDTDQSIVPDAALIAPGQVGQLAPIDNSKKLYPDDIVTPGKYMEFRTTDWAGRKYAGFWDDVYMSVDGNNTTPQTPHSYITGALFSDPLNTNWQLGETFIHGYKGNIQNNPGIDKFGVNWTSQSTTGMGERIAAGLYNWNGSAYGPNTLEKDWYFKNCLRAGPAHTSYQETDFSNMNDAYEALLPCYYNSIGSSGTETYALQKMIVAGGFLPKALKPELKRHGIYIATMLYIWKATFPFDAPFDNEMKHRVCYASSGGYVVDVNTVNRYYHLFKDSLHMAAMVDMAKNMTVAPPIALIKKVSVTGGTEKYFNKTAALIHQAVGETITIQVSTADCYDIVNLPLTKKWKLLCGNPNTTITGSGDSYTITVPYDPNLPKGRTTIVLTANNGSYDSNPACINIYRPDGATNKRPIISNMADTTIFPGGTVNYNLSAIDPEGYTCSFYKRTEDPGTITGNQYTWNTSSNTSTRTYPLAIICSDGTTGINSKLVKVRVSRTIAKASANIISGSTPLTVNFSSLGSGDSQGNTLSYNWSFDDGTTSTNANPQHIYTSPGYYRVRLAVAGPLGADTAYVIVKAEQNPWVMDIDNGWDSVRLNPTIWSVINPANGTDTVINKVLKLKDIVYNTSMGIQTVKTYDLPFYLETEFTPYYIVPEDGFQLLGNRLGWDYGSNPFSFKNLTTTTQTNIGTALSFEKTTLRIFVTADPYNPGKARYAGYFDSKLGNYFFSIGNQSYTAASIKNIKTSFYEDIFSVKVWAPGSLSSAPTLATKTDGLVVYPNPASNTFTVELAEINELNTLTIIDLAGRVIKNIQITPSSTLQINIPTIDIPSGVYFVEYGNYKSKIIVNH